MGVLERFANWGKYPSSRMAIVSPTKKAPGLFAYGMSGHGSKPGTSFLRDHALLTRQGARPGLRSGGA